jgi:hypothetical protein
LSATLSLERWDGFGDNLSETQITFSAPSFLYSVILPADSVPSLVGCVPFGGYALDVNNVDFGTTT